MSFLNLVNFSDLMFSHPQILFGDILRFARIVLEIEEALGDITSDKTIITDIE